MNSLFLNKSVYPGKGFENLRLCLRGVLPPNESINEIFNNNETFMSYLGGQIILKACRRC